MRKLILLALAGVFALPAHGGRRLTVAQLEGYLSSDIAENHADGDIARQIGGMELSERLTPVTLGRLSKRFPLQARTALALQLLSDQSAFLDPPASELPATAPPDPAEQQRMLQLARGYVVNALPGLPNFFATRITHRFDDSAQVLKQGEWPVRAGLHPVGNVNRTVTFRDGQEVADAAAAKPAAAQEIGLHTWGEFGPEIAVVLTDLANGTARFHHWEQVPTGIVAVYRYSVPASGSHYVVHYCCTTGSPSNRTSLPRAGPRNSPASPPYGGVRDPATGAPYDVTPGYRGELSVDPATGAVMRITLEAELKPGSPLSRAASVVEYGPVSIGDRTFVCPVRSLAISSEEAGAATAPGVGAWPQVKTGGPGATMLLINETDFKDYHRLGSSARIVADASTPDASDQKRSRPKEALPSDGPAKPAGAEPKPPSEAVSKEPSPVISGDNQPSPVPAPISSAPSPPAAAVIPEITMGQVNEVPDRAVGAAQADTGFSLKVTTRLVDIGLVATDKKGRPVTDLKPDEIEVYDGGRKQEIRFFGAPPVAPQATEPAALAIELPQQSFSNRAPDPAVPATALTAAAASSGTILLVDESHIAWNDMQNARNQVLKFLGALPSAERVGLYTMNGLGFHVLIEVTSDHATLTERLKKFMPNAQSLQQAQEEEIRNRQQFEYVHNVSDLNSVNGNHNDVPDGPQTVDPQLLTMGSNPARSSLVILAQVARHLASMPGHKNLVWISSDNVLADWQDQQVGVDKSPRGVEAFALRAREAMNEAHAAVYPFDVSQLEAGTVTADIQHANIQLEPAQAENLALAGGGSGDSGPSARDTGTGRLTAAMSQDLHPIQGTVRDLASATGGRPIRRSGDLSAALTGIVEEGHATYQISFSPEGPADDQYHNLSVKLKGRRGVTVRYRTGYLYAKEPVTLKARFGEAIWRPTDVTEIGVRAQVADSGPGVSIKLNIAAADLGVEERGGRWVDKLDIFFIQRDDAGIHAQLEGRTLGLRLKPSTYQSVLSAGVPFELAVKMHPGLTSLRVLVVDENSGRMGSITVPAQELHPGQTQAESF